MIDDEHMSLENQHWLQQRQRSGNWINMSDTDEIPPEIVGPHRTMLHVFQIAFAPEIKRRLSMAQLDDSFFLTAAQLIQPEDGGREIRLNDEVRGLVLTRTSRSVNTGDSVFISDFKGFVGFELNDDELGRSTFYDVLGWRSMDHDFRFQSRSSEVLGYAEGRKSVSWR